jgi:hypothetical protein
VSKPPSNPQQGPATNRLDVVDIFSSKSFPVDFIPSNERFLVNFVLAFAAKDNQFNPYQGGIKRRNRDEIDCRSSRWTLLLPQSRNWRRCPSRWSLLHH